MPSVPRLTNRQVGPAVVRQPQESVASQPGMGIAAGLGDAAQRIQKVADEARVRGQNVRLNAAEVKVRELRNRILNDRDKGILNRRGEQALKAPEDAEREWMQGLSAIRAELGDPEVAEAFQPRADQLGVELRDVVNRHVTKEIDALETVSKDGILQDTLRSVQTDPSNAAVVDVEMARAEETLRGFLRGRGMPKDVQDRDVAKLRETYRLAQIETLATNPATIAQAKTLFDAAVARGEIGVGAARDRVERTLMTAQRGVVVNETAARILAATDNPTEQNELVKQLPIGEVRNAVRELVRGEQRAVKEAQDLGQEQAFDRLQRHVLNGGNLSDPSVAKDLAEISVTQTESLQRYTAAPTTDNAAWMEWYQLASDPEALAKLSESEFRAKWSRLTTSHRNEAERDYRQAKAAPSGTAPTYVTPQTMIARAMRTLGGVDPFAPLSDIDPEKQPMVVQFEQAAAREIAALPVAKRNDPVEVQKVLDRMQMTFVREQASNPARLGNLQWGGRPTREERRGFQMTPSDTTGIFAGTTRIRLDQIPADSITGVDNILRANNVPVTDANREAAYTIQRFDLDGSRLLRWLNDNRR